jgi:hypothetical protein
MSYEGIPNIACIFQVVFEKKKFEGPYPIFPKTSFSFFFQFMNASFFVTNIQTGLKFDIFHI